jgi:hypothetical protein
MKHSARLTLATPGPGTVAPEEIKARARPRGRERDVDPPTPERDSSGSELELMRAMQEYKQSSGRMFPTWSEVLRDLGYQREGGSRPPAA